VGEVQGSRGFRLFGHKMSVFVTCPLTKRNEVGAGSKEDDGLADRASRFEISLT
jgi:hypothetical protein